jgi:hypothetical protein
MPVSKKVSLLRCKVVFQEKIAGGLDYQQEKKVIFSKRDLFSRSVNLQENNRRWITTERIRLSSFLEKKDKDGTCVYVRTYVRTYVKQENQQHY